MPHQCLAIFSYTPLWTLDKGAISEARNKTFVVQQYIHIA